jgi:hypothetical protein
MSLSEEPDTSFANWLYSPLMSVDQDFIYDTFGTNSQWLSNYLGSGSLDSMRVLVWESAPRAVFVFSEQTGKAIRTSRCGWLPCSIPCLASGEC